VCVCVHRKEGVNKKDGDNSLHVACILKYLRMACHPKKSFALWTLRLLVMHFYLKMLGGGESLPRKGRQVPPSP